MDINKTKLHYNSWVSTRGEPVACVSFLGRAGRWPLALPGSPWEGQDGGGI